MYESVRRVAGSIHGKSSASTTTGPSLRRLDEQITGAEGDSERLDR